MPFKTYAALILAAGFSTRMRRGCKVLLPLPFPDGRRNALECLARTYREAGVEHILVVSGQCRGEDIAAEARRLELDHAQNPQAERGMFSSVCTGLTALSAYAGCFIHPADIPLVRSFTLHALLAESRKYPDNALIPVFRGEEGHPPLLPAACFAAIVERKGEGSLRGALQTVPCRRVPVADGGILPDMDTDEDYDALCARALRRQLAEPEEAEALLFYRSVGERGLAHARTVGRIAECFAAALNAAGHTLDPRLALAGGLLHDLCKGKAEHEYAAGRELRKMGMPVTAAIVESHRDCPLAEDAPLTEKELVCLADKYVWGDRLVPLKERFGHKAKLFAGDEAAHRAVLRRLEHAETLARRFFEATNVEAFDAAKAAIASRSC